MNSFKEQSANSENPKWNKMIERQKELYSRENDLRTNFERDYTRVIHSNAYRRLKHKTQVFFSPESDHICTRIEHVTHVESISYTIAKNLGLNTELTRAIATAHDIGHSPFGHQGEKILSEISKKYIGKSFWHEKNGLDFVDKIELIARSFTSEDVDHSLCEAISKAHFEGFTYIVKSNIDDIEQMKKNLKIYEKLMIENLDVRFMEVVKKC